ncbi:hypothetical protein ASE92_06625 [Pedobacter sp. Leaf41]|nr:hypothetical protein ASE92_06625 [Pedobacter sp. Leaf41]
MKKLSLLIFSSLIFTVEKAQKQISIDSASEYIGQKVTVCDSVYSIKVLPHLTFVNMKGNYPDQKLTLVFYKKDLHLFNMEPAKLYLSKRICVKGRISNYEGKPQIIIRSLKQTEIK